MLTSSSSLLRGAGILRRLPLLVNLPSSRCRSCHRLVSSTTATTTTTNNTAAALLLQEPDPSLVDAASAPSDFDNSATVYRDFVTPQDGAILLADLIAKLKRRRYEKGHWDAVIVQYKETELSDEASLSTVSQAVLERVREQLLHRHFDQNSTARRKVSWLPCHAIDLNSDGGELNAHVDSVRFSGDIVAGLSLQSPSIMRLQHAHKNDTNNKESQLGHVDLHLPPLSLYVLTGPSRFTFTHQLLPTGSRFADTVVERGHRVSVIFRDAKVEEE